MSTYALIGYLAVIPMIGGYILYAREIWRGRIKTNAATWGMWAFGTGVITTFFGDLTGDPAKTAVFVACTFSAVGIFALSMWMKEFHPVEKADLPIFAMEVGACAIWLALTLPADGGNWFGVMRDDWIRIMSAVLALGTMWTFIPLLRTTWKHPEEECHTPWYVWGVAYAMALVVIIGEWDNGSPYRWWAETFCPPKVCTSSHFLVEGANSDYWIELLYPGVCLVFHPLVGAISQIRRRVALPSITAMVKAK